MWSRIKGLLGGAAGGAEVSQGDNSADGSALAVIRQRIDEVIDPRSGRPLTGSGLVSEPVLTDGRLVLTLTVAPEDVAAYQPVRDALEVTLSALPMVDSAFIVLTSEAPASRTVPGPAPTGPGAKPHGAGKPQGAGKPRPGQPQAAPPRSAPAGGRRIGGLDFSGIGAIIAVASGKGGVGKSTTTANLAVALARTGLSVGVLDADVYGPSIPRLFGVSTPPAFGGDKKATPPVAHGVKIMSMGFLVGEDTPMVWRAPMVVSALTQMLSDVVWAPLDVLLIDMPPGTGDTQLTLSQQVPLDGAVIVSTPQDLALIDARKGVAMFEKVQVPILGLVENMSTFICPHCGQASTIFGHGGARADAARLGVPFLGEVPLHMQIRETSDAGTPVAAAAPDGPQAGAYGVIAEAVWADVEARKAGKRKPPAIIIEDEVA